MQSSGVLDFLIKLLVPITNFLGFPKEIMPLALIRPISGSASIAVGTKIMSQYGVDSKIGLIVSTIMGSTETTLYRIAVYLMKDKNGCIIYVGKSKKNKICFMGSIDRGCSAGL